jgi:hypothetical protein
LTIHRANHDDVANAIAGAVVGVAVAQGGAAGWLEYLRRECVKAGVSFSRASVDMDDIRAAGPDFNWSMSSEPLHNVFVPAPLVPGTPGIRYLEGRPYIQATRSQAKAYLQHPAYRELNGELAKVLGNEEHTA